MGEGRISNTVGQSKAMPFYRILLSLAVLYPQTQTFYFNYTSFMSSFFIRPELILTYKVMVKVKITISRQIHAQALLSFHIPSVHDRYPFPSLSVGVAITVANNSRQHN